MASCQVWEQAVRTHPDDKLLEQNFYKSAAVLLQLVLFYIVYFIAAILFSQIRACNARVDKLHIPLPSPVPPPLSWYTIGALFICKRTLLTPQVWCSSSTESKANESLLTDDHSPERIRYKTKNISHQQ